MANGAKQQQKWMQVSRLVNQGSPSYEDLGVVFVKKDSDDINRNL
jgi:hypothetical protein